MGTSPTVIWGRELKTSVKVSMGQEASDKGKKSNDMSRAENYLAAMPKNGGDGETVRRNDREGIASWKESRMVILSTLLHTIPSVFPSKASAYPGPGYYHVPLWADKKQDSQDEEVHFTYQQKVSN